MDSEGEEGGERKEERGDQECHVLGPWREQPRGSKWMVFFSSLLSLSLSLSPSPSSLTQQHRFFSFRARGAS